MKLTPPKKIVFWIATVLAALGLLGSFVTLPFVSANAFWFVVVGFVLLWLGNAVIFLILFTNSLIKQRVCNFNSRFY